MTFLRLNQFHTDDPPKLDRELNSLEDNISKETSSIRAQYIPTVQPVKFVPSGTQTTFAAQFGQWIQVDTLSASGNIVLPPVSALNVGKRACIFWLPTGLHPLSLVCQIATDTINGSVGVVSLPFNLTQVFLDFSGYWIV